MEVFIFTGYRKKILLCILRQRKRHRNKVTGLKFQEEAMDMEKIADSLTLHNGVKIPGLSFLFLEKIWQPLTGFLTAGERRQGFYCADFLF